MRGKVDVVLLNPPFSCRGNTALLAPLPDGRECRCSVAMAFLLNSLAFLRTGGECIALLPLNTLYSEKDARAWMQLRETTSVRVVSQHEPSTFEGCRPKTVVVHIRLDGGSDARAASESSNAVRFRRKTGAEKRSHRQVVKLLRGRVRVDQSAPRKGFARLPFVHSTCLNAGKVDIGQRRTSARIPTAFGPAVLLPRVGAPSIAKLCTYPSSRPIVLSDCVFALQCESMSQMTGLYSLLRSSWQEIESLYGGTCARYLTVRRLVDYLRQKGVATKVIGRLDKNEQIDGTSLAEDETRTRSPSVSQRPRARRG
jgi:hypothetical protein